MFTRPIDVDVDDNAGAIWSEGKEAMDCPCGDANGGGTFLTCRLLGVRGTRTGVRAPAAAIVSLPSPTVARAPIPP